MGYIELGYSVGLSIGPLTASLLYYIGGYSLSFFFFGILMMLSLITLSYIEINDNIIDEDEEDQFNTSKDNIDNENMTKGRQNDIKL